MDISPIDSQAGATVQAVSTDQRKLLQAVKAVDAEELFGPHTELRFVMDRETNRMQVRILNRKTGEILNQVPPEYVLYLAEEKGRR